MKIFAEGDTAYSYNTLVKADTIKKKQLQKALTDTSGSIVFEKNVKTICETVSKNADMIYVC